MYMCVCVCVCVCVFVWSERHPVVSNCLWPHGLYSPWNSPDQNTVVGSLSLLQGIFPNPGIEPRSPSLQVDSLLAEPQRKPKNTGVGSLSLLQQSSWPRDGTGVSCIAGWFFTKWAIRESRIHVSECYSIISCLIVATAY